METGNPNKRVNKMILDSLYQRRDRYRKERNYHDEQDLGRLNKKIKFYEGKNG